MTEGSPYAPDEASLVAETLLQRAESLAQEAEEDEQDDRMSLLLFRLGEEWYAVELNHVREILRDYVTTPIPCVPSFLRGVVNIRGEILSLTDAAALMQLGAAKDGDKAPAIVIMNEECSTAMIVDEIGDIAETPVDGVEPPLSTTDRLQADYITGSLCLGERLVGLVNVDSMLQPINAADL